MGVVKADILSTIKARLLGIAGVSVVYLGPSKPGESEFNPAGTVAAGGVAMEMLVSGDDATEPRTNIERQSFTVTVVIHFGPQSGEELFETAANLCEAVYGTYAMDGDYAKQTWDDLAEKTDCNSFMGAVVEDPQYGTTITVHEFTVTYRFGFGKPEAAA